VPQSYEEAFHTALPGLMSELSEEHWCAGWLTGLEFSLWAMVKGDATTVFGMGQITERQLQLLKLLSEETGVWWHWPDDGDGPEPISLEEWEPLYAERMKGWNEMRLKEDES
jgi:hypothetical protein